MSQPSLSAQLAQLEAVLGVPLFERSRRRVILTPAGEDLVGRTRRVLLEAESLSTAAQRFHDPLAGTLRIGIIPTVSPYLLPELAPALREQAPRLTVVWSEEKTHDLLRDLAVGRVDAAVLAEVARMEEFDSPCVARAVAPSRGTEAGRRDRAQRGAAAAAASRPERAYGARLSQAAWHVA